jgi:hypothetical protein
LSIQALFDHGRLVAAHTSVQTAVGIGSSAAGRVSVHHPFARRDVAALGEHLNWHGGLTLDYLFDERSYAYIECNPRTVEPANAAASGVNLPELQLCLSMGEHPDPVPAGQQGIRTHSSLAILLGTAFYRHTRRAVLKQAFRLLLHRDVYRHSREQLTPVFTDFPSLVPLAAAGGYVALLPDRAERIAAASVAAYSVSQAAVARVLEAAPAGGSAAAANAKVKPEAKYD